MYIVPTIFIRAAGAYQITCWLFDVVSLRSFSLLPYVLASLEQILYAYLGFALARFENGMITWDEIEPSKRSGRIYISFSGAPTSSVRGFNHILTWFTNLFQTDLILNNSHLAHCLINLLVRVTSSSSKLVMKTSKLYVSLFPSLSFKNQLTVGIAN